MTRRLLPLGLLLGGVVLDPGCTASDSSAPREGSAEPPPPAVAPAAGDAEASAAASEATKTEASAEGPAEGDAEEPAPDPSALRLAATREGWLELLADRDRAVLILDGEPIPILDGRPVRQNDGDRGLEGVGGTISAYFQTLAFTGDPSHPEQAWLTTVQHFDRQASAFTVHERVAEGWRPVDLNKGLLRAYYGAYVQRGDAVLALRQWAIDPLEQIYEPDDESPAAQAHGEAFERALRRAEPAWVRLAGPEQPLPEIPDGVDPTDAIVTDDGSLYMIGTEEVDGTEPLVLLTWPKGATKAERIALPPDPKGIDQAWLFDGGEHAIVAGAYGRDVSTCYLAVGRGSTWETIEVSTPGRGDDATYDVVGVARTPKGELWIAFGSPWEPRAEPSPVWRKPKDGPWEPVELPTLAETDFPRGRSWEFMPSYEGYTWQEVARGPVTSDAWRSTGLVGVGEEVWVTLEVGTAYPNDEMSVSIPRSVLLTNRPKSEPALSLPSSPTVSRERHDEAVREAKPGRPPCQNFSIVLGPPPSDPGPLADALLELELPQAILDSVYVATVDGTEVLVASAMARGTKGITGLTRRITEVTEQPATLECRALPVVRRVRAS